MGYGSISDNKTEFSIYEQDRGSEGNFYLLFKHLPNIQGIFFLQELSWKVYLVIPFLATFGEMILVNKRSFKINNIFVNIYDHFILLSKIFVRIFTSDKSFVHSFKFHMGGKPYISY